MMYNDAMGTAHIHTDASTNTNPGTMRIGYVISNFQHRPVARVGMFAGYGSINVAEYLAIIAALRHAFRLGFTRIKLYTDSQLVARQLQGHYKVKNPELARVYREVRGLIPAFDSLDITWVRREHNVEADALTRQIVSESVVLPLPEGALMAPWQAVRIRRAVARGAIENTLKRAIGTNGSGVKEIVRGRQYRGATEDDAPMWDTDPTLPVLEAVAPPQIPSTSEQETTDEDSQGGLEAGPKTLRADVRQALPIPAGEAAQ